MAWGKGLGGWGRGEDESEGEGQERALLRCECCGEKMGEN